MGWISDEVQAMMAERLYQAHREYAATLGIELPPWDCLTPREMIDWDAAAFEQTKRDRELPTNLQELESYGPTNF